MTLSSCSAFGQCILPWGMRLMGMLFPFEVQADFYINGLPTDEVQKIYQDKEGFCGLLPGMVSVNTTVTITVYKSSLNPGLLTSNNIYCFADDNDGFLWIGTQEG